MRTSLNPIQPGILVLHKRHFTHAHKATEQLPNSHEHHDSSPQGLAPSSELRSTRVKASRKDVTNANLMTTRMSQKAYHGHIAISPRQRISKLSRQMPPHSTSSSGPPDLHELWSNNQPSNKS